MFGCVYFYRTPDLSDLDGAALFEGPRSRIAFNHSASLLWVAIPCILLWVICRRQGMWDKVASYDCLMRSDLFYGMSGLVDRDTKVGENTGYRLNLGHRLHWRARMETEGIWYDCEKFSLYPCSFRTIYTYSIHYYDYLCPRIRRHHATHCPTFLPKLSGGLSQSWFPVLSLWWRHASLLFRWCSLSSPWNLFQPVLPNR